MLRSHCWRTFRGCRSLVRRRTSKLAIRLMIPSRPSAAQDGAASLVGSASRIRCVPPLCSSTCPNRPLHQGGGFSNGDVLPDAENRPALLGEEPPCLPVSLTVPSHLGCPEACIRLGRGVVLGTPMPEAPVYEHRQPCTRENDVGCSPNRPNRASVHEIAQAPGMQGASQRDFGTSIPASICPHGGASCRGGRPRRSVYHALTLLAPCMPDGVHAHHQILNRASTNQRGEPGAFVPATCSPDHDARSVAESPDMDLNVCSRPPRSSANGGRTVLAT